MAIFAPLALAIRDQLIFAQANDQFAKTAALIESPLDGLREDEELRELRVDVLIGDKTCEPMDRYRQKNTARLDVVIRQKIVAMAGSTEELNQVNNLMAYAEELDEYLSDHGNRRPPGAQWAGWQQSETVIPYSPRLLREDRLFYSLFRLSYFVATSLTNPDTSS